MSSLPELKDQFARLIESSMGFDTLNKFVVWLDIKVAEYKIFGGMKFNLNNNGDNESLTSNWIKSLDEYSKSLNNSESDKSPDPVSFTRQSRFRKVLHAYKCSKCGKRFPKKDQLIKHRPICSFRLSKTSLRLSFGKSKNDKSLQNILLDPPSDYKASFQMPPPPPPPYPNSNNADDTVSTVVISSPKKSNDIKSKLDLAVKSLTSENSDLITKWKSLNNLEDDFNSEDDEEDGIVSKSEYLAASLMNSQHERGYSNSYYSLLRGKLLKGEVSKASNLYSSMLSPKTSTPIPLEMTSRKRDQGGEIKNDKNDTNCYVCSRCSHSSTNPEYVFTHICETEIK